MRGAQVAGSSPTEFETRVHSERVFIQQAAQSSKGLQTYFNFHILFLEPEQKTLEGRYHVWICILYKHSKLYIESDIQISELFSPWYQRGPQNPESVWINLVFIW